MVRSPLGGACGAFDTAMPIPARTPPGSSLDARRAPRVRARWLVGVLVSVLAVTVPACAANDEEVGDNRARPNGRGGQGGAVGSLPGASGKGGVGSAGGTSTGSGGGLQGFTLRAGGLGRDQAASGAGMKVRFGGVSPLGRVCNDAFCVTGDLR